MKLPNAASSIIDLRKVSDYLLNGAHPDNGGKAAFFRAIGFSPDEPGLLVEALGRAAREDAMSKETSPHGDKYVIDVVVTSPGGRSGSVRTVWIIDGGATTPRFVTAYPRR
jgi:hypothetical protein